MNINQWIDDLDHANPPSESPAFTSHPRATRKHGRGSGKDSLLEPCVDRIRHTRHAQPAESSYASSSATSSVTHTSSSGSSSTASSLSSKRYHRKPRHRTKADKYHRTTNKTPRSKKKMGKKDKTKNKKRERKAKHSQSKKHKSEVITGVVQSFHAKNVLKNRLTLNPGSKVGLYTKARSSGPTRGKGLPDLVFSEMRFLQKPEPVGRDEHERTSNKKHKKRYRELSEQEISRFFDASKTRPEDDSHGRERYTTPLEASAALQLQRTQTASPVVSNLPEKPFFGFGSRGKHPPTTSYYSWSDSGRVSSTLAKQAVPTFETLAIGQLQSGFARNQTQAVSIEHNANQQLLARQAADRRHGGKLDQTSELISDPNRSVLQPARTETDKETASENDFNRDKVEMPMPTPTAEVIVNHNYTNAASTDKVPLMGLVGVNSRHNDELEGPGSIHSKVLDKAGYEQHSEPWEELLQDCEIAARVPISAYYDDTAPQQVRHISHEYANLQLWRADGSNLPEYDHRDDMAFVDEIVFPDQSEVVNDWDEDDQSYGDRIDDNLESLLEESQHDYGMPIEDEADWEQVEASRHNGLQHYRIQEAEAMDEFASFWQPNKLY